MTLYDLSERAALIAQAVGDQETDEQMDAFDAFVEEFEADAGQKAQATLYVLDALGATAQRLKDQAKIITAKARAAESNAARLKERLKSLLMDIELTGSAALIELPEGTKLRLGKPAVALQIVDESAIGAQWRKAPAVDNARVKAALKSGQGVEGARLVDGQRPMTRR